MESVRLSVELGKTVASRTHIIKSGATNAGFFLNTLKTLFRLSRVLLNI